MQIKVLYSVNMRNEYGQFLSGKNHPGARESDDLTDKDEERFWAKVDWIGKGEDECWNWTAYKGPKGYGQFGVGHTLHTAHRVAWAFWHDREIPPAEICVCHKCDNPSCCNPSHMFLGTKADNNSDMRRKGRGQHKHLEQWQQEKGSKHRAARLTEEQVLAIRKEMATMNYSLGYMSGKYGVKPVTICAIIYGRIWKHVGGPIKGQKK